MPTVEEVVFDDDEYDSSDDEEEGEEEFSILDKVSDSIGSTYGGIKKYATPIWNYGGPILWALSTTSLLIVLPIILEVQKEQAFLSEMANAQKGGEINPANSPPIAGPLANSA